MGPVKVILVERSSAVPYRGDKRETRHGLIDLVVAPLTILATAGEARRRRTITGAARHGPQDVLFLFDIKDL